MNTLAPERSAKIIELRELLSRQTSAPPPRPRARLPTGLPLFDEALDGGLWKGGMVELLAPRRSCGSASLLCAVIQHLAGQNLWTALIDAADTFDPQWVSPPALARLLWLRCHHASEAMQSADLLLRDGNLPLICLDLHSAPAAQLRQIASTTWYRLQRMIEPTAVALLTVSPSPLVPCADVRVELPSLYSMAALEAEPAELWREMKVALRRSRAELAANAEPYRRSA